MRRDGEIPVERSLSTDNFKDNHFEKFVIIHDFYIHNQKFNENCLTDIDWEKIIKDKGFLNITKQKFENSVKKGIPNKYKINIWLIITKVEKKKSEFPQNYYKELFEKKNKWTNIIEKDVLRTFFPKESKKSEIEIQNSLRRILQAHSNHNKEVGYTQGLI